MLSMSRAGKTLGCWNHPSYIYLSMVLIELYFIILSLPGHTTYAHGSPPSVLYGQALIHIACKSGQAWNRESRRESAFKRFLTLLAKTVDILTCKLHRVDRWISSHSMKCILHMTSCKLADRMAELGYSYLYISSHKDIHDSLTLSAASLAVESLYTMATHYIQPHVWTVKWNYTDLKSSKVLPTILKW